MDAPGSAAEGEALDVKFRELEAGDEELLYDYLYLTLFVPRGRKPFPRAIVRHPSFSRYVAGWGRENDVGYLALASSAGPDIGAAWLRLMREGEPGFGYYDARTPEHARRGGRGGRRRRRAPGGGAGGGWELGRDGSDGLRRSRERRRRRRLARGSGRGRRLGHHHGEDHRQRVHHGRLTRIATRASGEEPSRPARATDRR